MDTQFWRRFAIGFIIINTLCAVLIIELLILGHPYISSFIALITLLFILNKRLVARYFPSR